MYEEQTGSKNDRSGQVVTAVLSSFLTALAILGVVGVLAVTYGERVLESAIMAIVDEEPAERTEEREALAERLVTERHEDLLVRAAELADPAVVSVVGEVDSASAPEVPSLFEEFFRDPFRDEGERGSGSGFIVSGDGYIVTNRHVVEREEADYSVLTNDGRSLEVEVVARDPVLDVAVLKVKNSEDNFEYLDFGDSDRLQLGQSVMAIGNALGEFQNSVSVGVISGLSRSVTARDGRGGTELLDEVIQTDAAINFGNSGGPLLDLNGRVIGVNVAMAAGQQNIGFAIPSNLVQPVVESVRETGRIVRAFLGIRYAPVTPMIREQEGLEVNHGVLIVPSLPGEEPSIVPGSPADEVGLQEGDIILEFNDQLLDRKHSLAHIIRRLSVGDEVELLVVRDGERFEVTVTLTEAPE